MSPGTRLPDRQVAACCRLGRSLPGSPQSGLGWLGCLRKGQIQEHKVVQEKGTSQDSRPALDSHEVMGLISGLGLLLASALGPVRWRGSRATCPEGACVGTAGAVDGASLLFMMRRGRTAPRI